MKGAKYIVVVVIAALLVIMLMQSIAGNPGLSIVEGPKKLTVTELKQAVQDRQVDPKVKWDGEMITGKFVDNEKPYVVSAKKQETEYGATLSKWFEDNNINVEAVPTPVGPAIFQAILFGLLPAGLLFFVIIMMMRQAQASGHQAMSFGRSRARRASDNTPKVTFEDVAGIDEAKEELFEVVDFLRNTKKYVALGAKIPKGMLLVGPPGVGKTHLARAIAGEAGVPFFHISGSEFVEMFVGVGAARVRDLFETARAHRPCLVFVDEIDAVGRQRGTGVGGGNDEREQTLNQLLVEMDGFEVNSGVVILAATNRADVLDEALLRPGRFDRKIMVDAPNMTGRLEILKIHSKGKPLASDIDLQSLAKRSPGFTGADLANSLNEAALLAARRNHAKVTQGDLEEALDRVLAGPARKSRVMDEKERKITAYHEAGHALVGELLEFCDPIHKVTILPRGMSLGSTWALPETDSYHTSRQELFDDISMSLGGLLAEEIVYGERWTGAYGDLKRVTRVARAMVTSYGMSERLGTLAIGRDDFNPFLGRRIQYDRDYSEEVAKQIDEEVKRIVDHCSQRARQIIEENRSKLDAIADALLDRETLDREEFLAIMAGNKLPDKPEPDDTTRPEQSEPKAGASIPPVKLEPGTA